jgi:exodeoxyribonuclease V gamma subunit
VDSGLFVYRSDRLEELAEALALVLQQTPLPPLRNETILVPNLGLARWLQQQLALRTGIAAGLDMPFPGAWLEGLGRTEPNAPDPFHGDVLLFRLFRCFDDPALTKRLGSAAAYVADDPDQRKRLQLCERIGRCFDDYQLYRPELLRQWADGAETGAASSPARWQAELWRALLDDAGLPVPTAKAAPRKPRRPETVGPMLFAPLPARTAEVPAASAHRLEALLARCAEPTTARQLQPHRLLVFGLATLAPPFLSLLTTLARHQAVHLFVPSPTPPPPEAPAAWLWERNGGEARDFHDALQASCARGGVGRLDAELGPTARRPPLSPAPPLLTWLQHHLIGDPAAIAMAPPLPAAAGGDDSLRVHVCHSPQRELEVVRDQILAAFAADPRLEPHEVLVLVPDIRRYAPFAHAVFGPVREHLPFHVADKGAAAELPLCKALLAVLDLAAERLVVHDVLHLLELPAVQQRFRIFAGDLPGLRARCQQAGIRWGLDGEARARQFHVPPFEENSWRLGLRRLLLGIATGPADERIAGTLPVGDATASREEVLVRFVHFAETLFAQLRQLQQPQPAAQWAQKLEGVAEALFAPTDADDETALAVLRTVLARLRTATDLADYRAPLQRPVLRAWLDTALARQPSPRGFLAGAVTVAALVPMRAVPCRAVFVCGLDDSAFPRRDAELSFDLIQRTRRPGDRSLRADDRQMFLDLLLSARQTLHFTYVGRSAKDDSEIAPSAVVAELLDWLDEQAAAWRQPALRPAVVVPHPLQPWSRRYRDGADPRLFTWSRADLEPSPQQGPPAPWFDRAVEPPPELTGPVIPLELLLEFWKHPSRFFLRRVLGVRLLRSDDPEPLTEPFELNNLDNWRVENALLNRLRRSGDAATDEEREMAAWLQAKGELPVGGAGQCRVPSIVDTARAFHDATRRFGPRRRVRVAAGHGEIEVQGELTDVAASLLVVDRLAKVKGKDLLRGWILHVVAAVARHQATAAAARLPERSCIIGKDTAWTLEPLDPGAARAALATLVRGFQHGLRRPLPYFALASAAWGSKRRTTSNADACMAAAATAFGPTDFDHQYNSELYDADVQLCWRGREPLRDPEFATWATEIWGAFALSARPST